MRAFRKSSIVSLGLAAAFLCWLTGPVAFADELITITGHPEPQVVGQGATVSFSVAALQRTPAGLSGGARLAQAQPTRGGNSYSNMPNFARIASQGFYA